MTLNNVPDEVDLGTSLDDAMQNVSAEVTYEEGVKKTIPASELYFSAINDMNVAGEKTLTVIYNKTFKGEASAKPIVAYKPFKVVQQIASIKITKQPTRTTYYFYKTAATEAMGDRTMAFDPTGMEPSENEAAMTDCLSGVMTMQITYAARDSDFDGFDIHAGDYLGLCDGALAGTTQDITALLATLADKAAAAGKEFINIFYGADISEADAEQALALFQQHAPDAEVNLVSGGQPIYYYLISAE